MNREFLAAQCDRFWESEHVERCRQRGLAGLTYSASFLECRAAGAGYSGSPSGGPGSPGNQYSAAIPNDPLPLDRLPRLEGFPAGQPAVKPVQREGTGQGGFVNPQTKRLRAAREHHYSGRGPLAYSGRGSYRATRENKRRDVSATDEAASAVAVELANLWR